VARIRQVKPELFDDPDVGQLPAQARWLFAGLLTQADREGRIADDPRRLKTRLCAYDDTDVDAALALLADARLIIRYVVDSVRCIQIRTFSKHQKPHPKEADSTLPPCPMTFPACSVSGTSQISEQIDDAVKLHGKPGNLTASSADSGSLVLGSGILVLGSGGRGTGSGNGAPSVPPAPRAPERRPVQGSGAGVGTYPRDHLRCVQPCGRVCLPDTLFADFVKLRGGPPGDAERYVHGWHQRVSEAWTVGAEADLAIGDDKFDFWRARWRDEHGTTRKATLEQSLYPNEPTKEQQVAALREALAAEQGRP
jgi:hypothetical protein